MGKEQMIGWEKALEQLKQGNQRFTSGLKSTQSLLSQERLKELAERGQKPFAIVLSCSDSRVPAELLFDCGFGDLFVIRVAGNVVQPSQIASIEYAAKVLEAPLCLVMGHSKCGAVSAAIDAQQRKQPGFSPNIDALIQLIRPSVEQCLEQYGEKERSELLELSIRENIRSTAQVILDKSPLLRGLVNEGKFAVRGAYCHLQTGHVEFEAASS